MPQSLKPLWRSRTFWLNAATLIVAVLVALSDESLVRDNPTAVVYFAAAIAAANVVLRYLTDSPVKLLIALWISLPFQPCWQAEAG